MFIDVQEAVRRIRGGRMIIVVDDADRENEGDLVFAAEKATPTMVNFAVKHGRGILCAPMAPEIADRLGLRLMVNENTAKFGTPFTESVDARRGTTTGTSAFDRARTLRVMADPRTRSTDLVRPGHVFPLRAVPGGVLRRAGHTEAAPDLCTLAGLQPVAAVCEILREDGRMARLSDLERFGMEHDLGILTIKDLIAHRRKKELLVRRLVSVPLPTPEGRFQLHLYESRLEGDHHVALVKGKIAGRGPVLTRVHSQCLTGDVFGSQRCDCGTQLHAALRAIHRRGRGVLLYLRQEGRGIGLAAKLQAYALQDQGLDTVEANVRLGYPADLRDYGIGAQILVDLGVREIELLTNNPRKLVGLEAHGLKITKRVPIHVTPNRYNRRYLRTKRDKLGHLLDLKLGET
ncbi:MAG: bifunctional 3,4-dihydroxy-2-butanone-4-phosphate synthase/GTP cyclohydrolase II [Candidatus Eisenbacteria bacterium]|uniref:Riboflavin biosynthesis protein RibBA n=1 Tax=Eiseniibacteriota bacterium TaxID=2212470 RepID=A0A538U1G0_UNCEI|nr:MAG: bifunctional 3,4-dihydroxy-2-butanone-4-phosphate synthase/GTP cyclohydrolase II [Candidatus Eisenbacteria bacterium]